MQNSGLGTSLNALASLALMYGLPALLLITWRGHLGKDAPEHILTGEISPGLLELLRIPHRVLSADTLEADLAWTVETMDRAMQPVALLVPPGVVEIGKAGHGAAARTRPIGSPTTTPADPRRVVTPPVLTPQLSRRDGVAGTSAGAGGVRR